LNFDIARILQEHRGQGHALLAEHVNPQLAKVLKTIGYDRFYSRAEGPYLYDERGAEYLDFLGGFAVCNVGRNHPVVKKALTDYLALDAASMVQFDAPVLAGVLAKELKERVALGLEYVFFANSGAEGVEAAIKMARCATGRPGLIYASNAFHGLTTGALSLNGCQSFREGFAPFLPNCVQVPFGDAAALEQVLVSKQVAAFIVEPIQGKGVNIPPSGYLVEAARLCKKFGTLFIADEVQTGVGRTGKFLALHHDPQCTADLVVMSKALSGGYVPVGAVLVRGDVWRQTFSSMDRAIVHSSTFHMGGLAMTAGLAVLSVYDSLRLADRAAHMGALLLDGLKALCQRFELVKQVRGQGLMVAVEFGEPRSLGLRAAWTMLNTLDRNLFAQAAVMPLFEDHRILCQVAGHDQLAVKLTPPLVIQEADVQRFLTAFESVLDGMHTFPGPAYDILKRLGKNAVSRRSYDQAAADSVADVVDHSQGTSPIASPHH
jgi:acetylornithine/succinyldiaminopimelate/putrescine aminotransferase